MLCSDNSAQHAATAAESGASILAVIPVASSPPPESVTRLDQLWTTFTDSLAEKWSADPSAQPGNPALAFTVATKYYNALVSAVRLDTHPSYHFTDTINAAEAICLLLDTPLADASSTSPLQDLLKDLPDVECKLIVSMGTDGEHESDWELGHLAMEHGFELIHWKATEGEGTQPCMSSILILSPWCVC
ncbi:hypothetical protein BCR44DRAFT_228496 [Catenaria anguillulae PL171]|uniref:Uncharacterized protein n=1 Tax=Catenaria anguillulae PL171 TaxID=765915 RepID=A0A1Y2I251_9FUNG|nr:hypothetical protein BCR44DRAFT_228496 [Catenaria anguillulae PL171]